ncbi:ATP-dependent RNA helicase TDRD9-like [Mytilus californianus]|uniref:ATP-dependent RNA helicase TDRD9-like n=1 Tax=Mytilus californianus TaxID=6549 RepID=UPI0022466167|nr:ATP-dependent RNA helicase TDRD9-like [Mytilus californianus]
MSRLRGEITIEEIDDWFSIGAKSVKNTKSVPRTATGGRFFNPETQSARVPTEKVYVPSYHQPSYNATAYAEAYRIEEEQDLFNSQSQTNNDFVGLGGKMEHLDLESIVSGSVAVPDDLVPENATDVYNSYNFDHRYDQKLPITQYRDQVLATIESNQVTVIQGSTGSGKTTQVPQYILDHYASMGKYCNIIVTQPRRIAAMSIARRVCSERNWDVGTICGYQVGMDRTANEDTRLLYVTTGVLLRKLIKTKNMLQFTHVILDEVHERDQETDFSLLIVRKLLRSNSRHVKVVMMSATFDSDMFGQYFAVPIRDRLEPAPVVCVEGKAYNVSEYYADDLTQLGEIPPLDETRPEISEQAYILACRLIQEFDNLDIKKQGIIKGNKFAPYRGTVLVFLPGYAEIENMQKLLKQVEDIHNLVIYPLHSSITLEEQSRVFRMPEEGERKIILSTNIAESSITVPDIKYVIDFCLTKSLVSDPDTNYTSLQLEWASRANCTQRKGRAGRVSDGRVYRMITRFFWETYIPDYGIPEMQRCPLEQLILQVKLLDLGQPKAILALALTPPNLNDIEKTILLLKEVGALSAPSTGVKNPYDGQLTFVGRVLAELPVDIRIGKLLMLGHVFGLLEECLIIGAALSLKSLFSKPFREHLNSFKHKLDWSHGSLSDQLTILNAYQEWERLTNMNGFRSGQNEVKWGKMHYLQVRRLRETRELIKDLEMRLNNFNIQKHRTTPNYKKKYKPDQERLLLKLVMCGAFYPNYFLKGEIDEEDAVRMMSGHDPLETVMVKGLPANQGSLYKQALEDQFRSISPHPTAYFEETRAYIKFPRKQENRQTVHPGVYLSVKHRLLNQKIEITLYSPEEASEKMEEIRKQQENAKGRLRSNRFTVGDQGFSEQKLQREPPPAETTMVVLHVTEVVDCGHFWAQYAEEKTQHDLFCVQNALNNENVLPQIRPDTYPRRGMFYAAPFEGELYRARIESVEREKDSRSNQWIEIVEVFFVDYGNTEKMRKEALREMSSDFLSIPFQAVECKLCEIRPSPIKCPDGTWTVEAKEQFKHLVINKNFIGQLYSIVGGILRLELMESPDRGIQVSINKELVNKGFADEAEETYLSRQNHEQREMEANAVVSPSRRLLQDEKPTFKDRQSDWFQLSLGSNRPASSKGRRTVKQKLNGPHNPYEMMFNSLTNVGRLRSVKTDPDSVNSVAIDNEPQDHYDRLMVSGFVGLNPAGSTMMARDTTIMPAISGLPSIISLLFCPVAELRRDRENKRYIGAICGLGVDRDQRHSLFPDHDMEITFDVEIDNKDISQINGVRSAINLAIGNEEKVSAWGPDAIYKIQEAARKKLLEVVYKRRERVDPFNYNNPYSWNQVDPDDLIETSLEGTPADAPHLLNLHKAQMLEEEVYVDKASPEYLKEHAEWLKKASKDYTKREPITCEICEMTWHTPQLLAIHIETRRHQEKVAALHQKEDY